MAVPLRIFGKIPDCLLSYQDVARSSRGADNRRGNIMEALSMHLYIHNERVYTELQEVWRLARLCCDHAAQIMGLHTYSAWQVVRPMQQVPPRIYT